MEDLVGMGMPRSRAESTGDLWRAIWPPGPRLLTSQAMLSAVADYLGLRDGAVLADSISGGGITGPFRIDIATMQQGDPAAVEARLTGRAAALGYRPTSDPKPVKAGTATTDCRFTPSEVLPGLFFQLVPAGGVLNGVAVPSSTTGVLACVDRGSTLRGSGFSELKVPQLATRQTLEEAGIDITPPAAYLRFWIWWWLRVLHRARMSRDLRKQGAFKGRVVARWLVGGALVGPYTLGVMAIRPARRDKRSEPTADAQKSPGTPGFTVVRYQAGEALLADGLIVPPGHIGQIATMTVKP